MSPKRAAFCLVVLLGLVAGADARACDACFDLPAIPALVEGDEPPAGPARIVDEAFNEIAASDDDDAPTLKAALIAYRASTDAFASAHASAQETEAAEEPARATTASLAPAMPVVSVAALLLIFMLACLAFVERRSSGRVLAPNTRLTRRRGRVM